MEEKSEIAQFYDGQAVFLTGVTGFVGKALLWKLLTSCHGLTKVYVLIKEKRGKSPHERLVETLANPIFESLRDGAPEKLGKVIAVPGDMSGTNLNLSAEDENRICQEVSIVFHAAASVMFNDPIQKAVQVNLQGTMSILALATGIKQLKAFVHISTAYSNCNRREIGEVLYSTWKSPSEVIEMIKTMEDDDLTALTPRLSEGRPSTYTLTKALAEQVVDSYRNSLPVCIIRPSIVAAAAREPIPGWVEGLNGATGISVAVYKGFLHCIHASGMDMKLDLIPVDCVVNLTLAAAWYTANAKSLEKEPYFIYNCCSGSENPLTFQKFFDFGLEISRTIPCEGMMWYPSLILIRNRTLYKLIYPLVHLIPSQLVDLAAIMTSRKPFMVKIYRKLTTALEVLEYYMTREFQFSTRNTKALRSVLSETDKELFNFDISNVSWKHYMQSYAVGMRKYILQESMSSVPETRLRILYAVDCAVKGIALVVAIILLLIAARSLINLFGV